MKKLGITILILCALGCCVGGGYYITTQKNNSQQNSQGKLISNNIKENTNLSTNNTKTSTSSNNVNTSTNNLETNPNASSPNSSTNQIGKIHSFTNLSQKTNNTKSNTANNTTNTSPLNNTINTNNTTNSSNINNSDTNNNLVNATTLPNDLSTINIPAGDYYFALGNKASQLAKPVSEVREMIYNAVKNKITNTGYINLTEKEQNIVSKGTPAQKEALMKKLGPNSLLINVTFNTFPTNNPNATTRPDNFTGGQFYYSFSISTLQGICENINNWSKYSGFISTNGTLLTNSQFEKDCSTKNFYYLNLSEPAYPAYFKLNV